MISFEFQGQTHSFKNPSFGNTNDLAFQRINRKSRSGDLIVFRDTAWPITESFSLTFDFLKEEDLERLQNLIHISTGEILKYTDFEGRIWEGIIQNPETEAVQASKTSWTINVIFEGEYVDCIN